MKTTTGPVALVTGAGSGLGRQIARALGADGYRVVLTGRNTASLDETAVGMEERALVIPADVGDPGSVTMLFATLERQCGRLDLLINNAGTFGPRGAVDEVSFDDWQHTVSTNLTGAFLCAHHAVRIMKAQDPRGGRIINNGSISAHSPRPNSVAYTATKHAITGLTKSISLDGRAHDIACGQIDIGNAATEMTSGIATGAQQADGSFAAEPTFDAQHVAEAVLLVARLPLDANVQFMTITATKMPYLGRG